MHQPRSRPRAKRLLLSVVTTGATALLFVPTAACGPVAVNGVYCYPVDGSAADGGAQTTCEGFDGPSADASDASDARGAPSRDASDARGAASRDASDGQ